ncbi:hypothetical protein EG68_12358 [Paragonimus skrjabini miyazakii]|uniref:hydroxymethylglutaryl-CoA lyase n=1 Tax=Paragonimus skrjabini miyazakii TaxID=59628 RepID=A0A8S9YDY3_9TREM|nr:hypothetical protein EG68_12358 [Paragonimus skrjabini miyazakii]
MGSLILTSEPHVIESLTIADLLASSDRATVQFHTVVVTTFHGCQPVFHQDHCRASFDLIWKTLREVNYQMKRNDVTSGNVGGSWRQYTGCRRAEATTSNMDISEALFSLLHYTWWLLNSDRLYTKFLPQIVIYKLNPMRLLMYRGFATVKETVRLVEVGPRDGLQNEKTIIPTDTKIALVNKLTNAGLDHIEVSSFVNPKWVPQLADALQVFQQIQRNPNTKYSALVPNTKGMLRAIEARPDEVAIFAAASETFSKRNINCSIDESLKRFDEVLKLAKHYQIPVRGYISCVLGCPYEKSISPDAVARVTCQLWERGCYEISLGDTIGVGTPERYEVVPTLASLPVYLFVSYGQSYFDYDQLRRTAGEQSAVMFNCVMLHC